MCYREKKNSKIIVYIFSFQDTEIYLLKYAAVVDRFFLPLAQTNKDNVNWSQQSFSKKKLRILPFKLFKLCVMSFYKFLTIR